MTLVKVQRRVEVFRNLTSKCYSVRRSGRVVAHTDNIYLQFCEFVIQQGGQARTRREHKKYIHALVRGESPSMVMDATWLDGIQRELAGWTQIAYNPYLNDTFVVKATGEPIYTAEVVFLGPKGCFANEVNKYPKGTRF